MSRSQSIYVFVSDAKGDEAVVVVQNGQALLPMVCLYEDSLDQMKEDAQKVAIAMKRPVRMVKFTAREDVLEFLP